MLGSAFVHRHGFNRSVGGSGGGKNDLPNAKLRSVLQDVDQAQDIDVGIVDRIVCGDLDAVLSRQVTDNLGPLFSEDLRERRIADVNLIKDSARVDVFRLASSMLPEIVDDADLMSGLDQGIHNMGANKPGPAGD